MNYDRELHGTKINSFSVMNFVSYFFLWQYSTSYYAISEIRTKKYAYSI